MRRLLWLSFIPFFLWSCEDKMDEHYEVPGWVKGSAWELLSDESTMPLLLICQNIIIRQYKMFLPGN